MRDSGSKLRRYLLEGVVIVASILLAFGIEAWWDGRQQETEVDALLELLVQDMEADLEELRERASRSDTIQARIRRLLLVAREQTDPPSTEELVIARQSLFWTAQTEPSLSAYDVVRGSEAWNEIPAPVKVALSEYMRGPYKIDRELDTAALVALTELAGEYDADVIWRDLAAGDESRLPEALAFLRDSHVRQWMLARAIRGGNEGVWQNRWVRRLPELIEEVSMLREAGR